MKAAAVAVVAIIAASALVAPVQAQGTFKPSRGTFGPLPAQKTYPPPTFGRPTPPSARAPRIAQPDLGPQTFKPYGVYPKSGGPPSAPKPPGYIDLYGNKKSEHPFLY